MNQLEQYIYDQLVKGYTPEQIRTFLVSKGYEQQQVEHAIIKAKEETNKLQLQQYISNTLKQGYQPQQIHDQLISKGYDRKTINDIFNQLNKTTYGGNLHIEHQHEVGNSSILKIGAMLLFVAFIITGGIFGFQHITGQTDDFKLLDVNAKTEELNMKSGDPLKFRVTMLNQGDPGLVDIFLTYTITTAEGNRVLRTSETKAFETTIRDIVEIDLPDLAPGTYETLVEANYKEQYASSLFTFFIIDPNAEELPEEPIEQPQPTEPEESDTPEPETPKPVKPKPEPTEPIIYEPTEQPNIEEIITEADDDQLFSEAILETNYEKAGGYCQAIEETALRDECFVYIATAARNVNYCNAVESITRQEDCKITFVLEGNAGLCSELQLPENQQLCAQYEQINALYEFGETGDMETLIGDLHVTPIDPRAPTEVPPHESIRDLDIGDVTFAAE